MRLFPLFMPTDFKTIAAAERLRRAVFLSAVMAVAAAFVPSSLLSSEKKIKEYDKEIKNTSAELKKIEDDLRKKRLARDAERHKEANFRKELRRIDSALASLGARRREINAQIRRASASLAVAQKSLMGARSGVESSSVNLKKSVNLLWLDKSRYSIFSEGSRTFERKDIIVSRQGAFNAARRLESDCAQQVAKWDSAARELSALDKRLDENLAQQKALKEEKGRLLTDSTARRVAIEDEIKELAETSKAFHEMLSELETKKKQTREDLLALDRDRAASSEFRGKLDWPVRGEIVLRFGKNKREDIDTPVISNGIRVKPPTRADVTASAKGECIFAGSFRSYGQMVVIDHGGSLYTVYGLLDDISVADGDKLTAGQKVGSWGNGGDGAIYFEVRYDGHPVDPLVWLKKQ
ncbi:MAG: peptidoglycan DD-metalloendopeptidase family protein [Endomicrobiia bacterium]|nr:peptidoglycan DD-metalloendopeptidase family protein [Endomicrobiia bacterium]